MISEQREESADSINLKVINNEDYMVNLCDSELIGTKVNGITVSEHFYGLPSNRKQAIIELNKATSINALGVKAVSLVKEAKGEVEDLEINGTPYTIIVKVFK
ncbi:MAG: DUF424 family protein [Candidatus Nanoarchaeia archaeon]|jgi:hypothetical protein